MSTIWKLSFAQVALKGVFGVIGSNCTEHTWPLDERSSSRGFLLSLELMGERAVLIEPRRALNFSLIGVDPIELADFMVVIFLSFANASSTESETILKALVRNSSSLTRELLPL